VYLFLCEEVKDDKVLTLFLMERVGRMKGRKHSTPTDTQERERE